MEEEVEGLLLWSCLGLILSISSLLPESTGRRYSLGKQVQPQRHSQSQLGFSCDKNYQIRTKNVV
jgi:hypothetical protein